MTNPKSKNDLNFEDIDAYDMNMIRDAAKEIVLNSPRENMGAEAVVKTVFQYIHAKGMKIVRDTEREPTWAKPNSTWYAPDAKKKNYYE